MPVPELVALDMPGGDGFVAALVAVWEAGDAIAVLDQRLAPPARRSQLEAVAPTWVFGPASGQTPYSARRADQGRAVADGDAIVMTTSGSTGAPKALVLTRDAVMASAVATSRRLGVSPEQHRWLACLPLSHIGGLSVVTRALVTSTSLEVHAGFDAERVMAAATTQTYVSLVPAALARVRADAFRRIVLGGSAPPDQLPGNVVTTYGMTETGSGVVYDGVPLEGVEVRLGEGAEILLRAPMMARAYRDGSPLAGPDGWLHTGDCGYFDHQRRLHVQGRLTDMLVTGGENVWPAPVEEVMGRHRLVAEVALSALPDPRWGERLVAVVVPADPTAPPSLDELREMVKAEIAAFAAPKQMVTTHALPRTSLGKLRRGELRRQLAARGEPTNPGSYEGPGGAGGTSGNGALP